MNSGLREWKSCYDLGLNVDFNLFSLATMKYKPHTRWITRGPDLPPELLQALEDGKLVFFCGAGVSYPAGLPSFRGLVEQVYARLGEPLGGIERDEFGLSNYDSEEARAVWQGYLWQPEVTPELLRAVKRDFLAALRPKNRLGVFEEQIATLFGYIRIDEPDWLSTDERQSALRSMDADGLTIVARVVFHRLQGAGDMGEALWTASIRPWLKASWPKDRAMVHPGSAFNLAMAATYAGAAFQSAVELFEPFLTGSDRYSHLIDRLKETDYPERSPSSVLRLLEVVDTNYKWPDQKLRALLARLQAAEPALVNDRQFRRLDEYLRLNNL